MSLPNDTRLEALLFALHAQSEGQTDAMRAYFVRRNFAAAGLEAFIDLREGDLRETLKPLEGPIDFMLCDIWTKLAAPALRLVSA